LKPPCRTAPQIHAGGFELDGGQLRPKFGRVIRAVKMGDMPMETIRPDNTDPIPLHGPPQRVGTIMIRFVGLLIVVIALLALVWSR
jgi:hypothetical protein